MNGPRKPRKTTASKPGPPNKEKIPRTSEMTDMPLTGARGAIGAGVGLVPVITPPS